jgi:acetoacetate decarboxylase
VAAELWRNGRCISRYEAPIRAGRLVYGMYVKACAPVLLTDQEAVVGFMDMDGIPGERTILARKAFYG